MEIINNQPVCIINYDTTECKIKNGNTCRKIQSQKCKHKVYIALKNIFFFLPLLPGSPPLRPISTRKWKEILAQSITSHSGYPPQPLIGLEGTSCHFLCAKNGGGSWDHRESGDCWNATSGGLVSNPNFISLTSLLIFLKENILPENPYNFSCGGAAWKLNTTAGSPCTWLVLAFGQCVIIRGSL